MLDWLGKLDPATLAAVCAVGWALTREIRAVGERVTTLETEVRLLLSGHKVVSCANNPSADVGPAPGTSGA